VASHVNGSLEAIISAQDVSLLGRVPVLLAGSRRTAARPSAVIGGRMTGVRHKAVCRQRPMSDWTRPCPESLDAAIPTVAAPAVRGASW
jgi:hypothetical protein